MNWIDHSEDKISDKIFKGKHTDFNAGWYADVGFQFMITMMVFQFQPFIDFVGEWSQKQIERWYHRSVYNRE
jgi:hypothetical protein